MCLHTYLILKAGLPIDNIEKSTDANHDIDRKLTIELATDLIIKYFPTATLESEQSNLLIVNKKFIENLTNKNDISEELNKHTLQQCPKCSGSDLVKWAHKTKNSFLITLCELKPIKIIVMHCKSCNILLYNDLYNFGMIPVHNKEGIRCQIKKVYF